MQVEPRGHVMAPNGEISCSTLFVKRLHKPESEIALAKHTNKQRILSLEY